MQTTSIKAEFSCVKLGRECAEDVVAHSRKALQGSYLRATVLHGDHRRRGDYDDYDLDIDIKIILNYDTPSNC